MMGNEETAAETEKVGTSELSKANQSESTANSMYVYARHTTVAYTSSIFTLQLTHALAFNQPLSFIHIFFFFFAQ